MASSSDISLAFALVVCAAMMSPLGALLSFLLPSSRIESIPLTLAFASGILIWVALAGLHPEALSEFGFSIAEQFGEETHETYTYMARLYVALSILLGIVIMLLVEVILHKLGFDHHGEGGGGHGHGPSHGHAHTERVQREAGVEMVARQRVGDESDIDDEKLHLFSFSHPSFPLSPPPFSLLCTQRPEYRSGCRRASRRSRK